MLRLEGRLLSSLASVRAGYKAGARRAMVTALRGWAADGGGDKGAAINVVTGPVFDYDLDGHQDDISHTLLVFSNPLVMYIFNTFDWQYSVLYWLMQENHWCFIELKDI